VLATKVADRQKWLWASTKVANRPPCSMPTSKSGCAVRPVCVPKVADARDGLPRDLARTWTVHLSHLWPCYITVS
jgi:hypothetical protein